MIPFLSFRFAGGLCHNTSVSNEAIDFYFLSCCGVYVPLSSCLYVCMSYQGSMYACICIISKLCISVLRHSIRNTCTHSYISYCWLKKILIAYVHLCKKDTDSVRAFPFYLVTLNCLSLVGDQLQREAFCCVRN